MRPCFADGDVQCPIGARLMASETDSGDESAPRTARSRERASQTATYSSLLAGRDGFEPLPSAAMPAVELPVRARQVANAQIRRFA